MGYLEILDSYQEEMIKTLGEVVSFPSVKGNAVRTQDGEILPFGRAVNDAFEYTLKKGREFGFRTYNSDNYGGHIEFSAEEPKDAEIFGIAAHLDVVPEGTGWTGEPYTMRRDNGNLYGRGVSDDKGPLVACLYAMKAIKEAGIVPKKNIRLILGLDEETEKDGMIHYLEDVGQPDMGFTPDGDFPMVNGEMGIMFFDLAQKLTRSTGKDDLRLTKMEAGTAPNAVPGTCKAVIAGDSDHYDLIKDRVGQYVAETGYILKAKKQGSSLVLESAGIAAHGAHPDLGLNAISIMMDFLGRLQFANEELNDYIAFYNDHIGFDLHGERLGCRLEDEPSGKLILNVGIAAFNEDIASLTVNIRYPVTCTGDQVYDGIEKTVGNNKLGIIKTGHESPVHVHLDNPMVKKMLASYVEETGDDESDPYIMAGGTYAKMLNHTIAFGGLFPGEEDTMHQVNEKLSIDSFFKMARIYARAIYTICCEEE